jgi:uncharacterized protein
VSPPEGIGVAVVTGASSGIGAATARLLADRGWRCVLLARREEPLRALAGEIDGEVEVCDVSDRSAVDETARRVLERHPAVRLLVNNAGFLARGTFVDVDLDLAEQALRVNYLGGVWTTRSLLPGLRAAASDGAAHVVNVASIGGTIAFAPASPYSASKHAQLAFSRSLRAALHGTGIEVHTVLPGFVTTPGFPHPTVFGTRLGRRFVVGPEQTARAIVAAVERGRGEVVVPWFPYRLGAIAQALLPTLTARVLARAHYSDELR